MTTETDAISEKLAARGQLSPEDVTRLETSADILWLGTLADTRRRELHGDVVTFVRVHEFCPGGDSASVDSEIPAGAGEVRIAATPASTADVLSHAEMAVTRAGAVPVTAFALDELAARCNHHLQTLEQLLTALRAAGVAMLAETRADPRLGDWLSVCRTTGLDVARLTVDGESRSDLARLNRLAAADSRSPGRIRAFAPLSQTADDQPSTGYTDVRQVALARLLVDNIESIQVDWSRYGPKLAQVALTFGANDIDAVSPLDEHEQGWRRRPLEEITRNIRATAGVPVERDGRFEKRDA
jgi:aminodeoxyfutalosine synthase